MRQEFKQHLYLKRGFTLVEMVIVIAVLAILGGISSIFISRAMQGYANSESYLSLVDMSDHALRRMKREIRNAVPNSVRISNDGLVLEFIPIQFGGRYRVGLDNNGNGDPLNFAIVDNSFDVLGPPVPNVNAGNGLIIYNLGIPGADAYAGDNYRLLQAGNNLGNLSFVGNGYVFGSPSRRFYVVASASVLICDLGQRRLWLVDNYPIVANLPANINNIGGGVAHLLADDVTACQFRLDNGIQQRSGVLSLNITLSRGPATVRFFNTIDLVNSA